MIFRLFDWNRAALRLARANNTEQARQISQTSANQLFEALTDEALNKARVLSAELDDCYRYRRRLVAERNALRDEIAQLMRTEQLQARALSHLARHTEVFRRAMETLHRLWAADRPAGDPHKSGAQLAALVDWIETQIEAEPNEPERAKRQVDRVLRASSQGQHNS